MHNYLAKESGHLASDYKLAGRPFKQIVSRLDSLLMVLKSCKAKSCHRPWSTLHPDGDVRTLKDALHTTFDVFYKEQPRVSFSSCQLGYLVAEEGPQDVNVWSEGDGSQQPLVASKQKSFQYDGDWSLWT